MVEKKKKRQVSTATVSPPSPGSLKKWDIWFSELSPRFSVDQKSFCWDFKTGNASEMLSFLSQREQLNDGTDPILVT